MNIFSISEDIDSEIYIKLLISVAKSDNKLQKEEVDYINLSAKILDIDPKPYWEDNELNTINTNYENLSNVSKFSLIRDCIVLGYIDNDLSANERNKILEFAKKLGVSESDVYDLEIWLLELWHVLGKGEALILEKASK